jgi:hypothetical protein
MSTTLGERDGPCHLVMLHRPQSYTAGYRHAMVSERHALNSHMVSDTRRVVPKSFTVALRRRSLMPGHRRPVRQYRNVEPDYIHPK